MPCNAYSHFVFGDAGILHRRGHGAGRFLPADRSHAVAIAHVTVAHQLGQNRRAARAVRALQHQDQAPSPSTNPSRQRSKAAEARRGSSLWEVDTVHDAKTLHDPRRDRGVYTAGDKVLGEPKRIMLKA